MSERVERRLVGLLADTRQSPYGNPIPGLDHLGGKASAATDFRAGAVPLTDVVTTTNRAVELRRLAEPLQADVELLASLKSIGAQPGLRFSARRIASGDVIAEASDGSSSITLDPYHAGLIFVGDE